ncbi:hypothetical protein ACFQ3F_21060 [Nocardioides ginsengisoli]|uniref:Lipoprotein n=1 Tax=Nocardioides ginsengisoli TaxID=363868 RepID=A0ABW3W613_9ACTN
MLPSRPVAAVLTAVLLLAAACSSDADPRAEDAPTTPTVAPRTPPPTVAAKVLASPQAKAVEAWAAAYARAVNAGDHGFAGAADPSTPAVKEWMERHAGSEWGRYFPGPLPVAPVGVRPVDATHREVDACAMVSGWTQQSRSVRRTRSREVVGMTFHVTSSAGRWRVERITSASIDCRGVVPRLRGW